MCELGSKIKDPQVPFLMRKVIRCQRIAILSLLALTVFTPMLFFSRRVSNSASSIGDKEFLDDINSIKQTSDFFKLEAVEQELEVLKEPDRVVYEDSDYVIDYTGESFNANVTINASENNVLLKKHEVSTVRETKQQIETVPYAEKGPTNQVDRIQPIRSFHSRKSTDEKVRMIKDHLLKAKSYLNFAPINSKSHLIKELRKRIKDLEHALGDATEDSDLSKRALQRMRNIENVLNKAGRVYTNCNAMATKLRAMTFNSEEEVLSQFKKTTYLTQLAARTFPRGLHCLSMQLTADYFSLPPKMQMLANKQKLQQKNLYHYAIFSNNIIACAVVVNSTLSTSKVPDKVVFHVVTDKLNHLAMMMWFLANPPGHGTVQVENMDDFQFLPSAFFSMLKQQNPRDPRFSSALNHLRFFLPEIFPKLDKIVLLDHDVVVQRDLQGLWHVDLKGKVNGAVETCGDSDPFLRMDLLINFSDSTIAKRFDARSCTWAFGMNIFDLREWRLRNLTSVYLEWLLKGKGKRLWKAGSLPMGLITFYNLTMALDQQWHLTGLGHKLDVVRAEIERAAVIHYDGSRKPWLEIGIAKYRRYWNKFVNYDHPRLQQCNIHPE